MYQNSLLDSIYQVVKNNRRTSGADVFYLYRDLMQMNIVDTQADAGQNPNQKASWNWFTEKWMAFGMSQLELVEIKDLYYKWREE